MRYLQYTKNIGIEYNGDTPFNFQVYSGKDWAEDRERRRSTSRNVFLMAVGAVSWANKRQAMVAAPSTQAEYMAAAFAAKEAIWQASDRARERGALYRPRRAKCPPRDSHVRRQHRIK